jgi:ubiquitin carboxyl-terminal hydrolase 1
VLYRLAAVVCHYGQHSFGHYVCFRRKPRGFGRVAPPRLDEPPAAPGRGWLRASDDAVREVGIEEVLQEGAGAFMLYYERVSNGDRRSVWSQRGGMDEDGLSGGEQKTQTHHLWDAPKWESSEEEEKEREQEREVPVVKARVVRSVSLGRDDDDDGVSVTQEMGEADPDAEARLLSWPTIARPDPVEVEPASAVSAEAPPPILDTPSVVVDEPPITVPRTVVDLRA